MFIVFEGIDGSGKSTQIQRLASRLSNEFQLDVDLTHEPTKWETGKLIRSIFSSKVESTPEALAGLFMADRLEHILRPEVGIQDQLKAGKAVLCDRYLLSSLAYQGAHTDMDWVMQINQKAANKLIPDLTIYLDIQPETGFERVSQSRDHIEIYETLENLRKVRENYEEAINKYSLSKQFARINAEKSTKEVGNEIWSEVLKVFSQLKK